MEEFFKGVIEAIVNVSQNFGIGEIFLVLCGASFVVFLINLIAAFKNEQADTYYKLSQLNKVCLRQLETKEEEKIFFANFHKQAKKGTSRATEVYKTFLETNECRIHYIFDTPQILGPYAKVRSIVMPIGIFTGILMFVFGLVAFAGESIALCIAKALVLPLIIVILSFILHFIATTLISKTTENIQTVKEFLKQNLAKLFKNQDEFFEVVEKFEEEERNKNKHKPEPTGVTEPSPALAVPKKEEKSDAVILDDKEKIVCEEKLDQTKIQTAEEKDVKLEQLFVLKGGSIEDIQAQLKEKQEDSVDVFKPVTISKREDEVEKVLNNYVNSVGFKIVDTQEPKKAPEKEDIKPVEVKQEPVNKVDRIVDVNLLEASLKFETEREEIEAELAKINTSLEAERDEFAEVIAKETKNLEAIKRNRFLAKDDDILAAYTLKETEQENKVVALKKLMKDSETSFKQKEKLLRAKLVEKEQVMALKRKLAETQQASRNLEADSTMTVVEKAKRKQSINDALVSLLDAMERYENK